MILHPKTTLSHSAYKWYFILKLQYPTQTTNDTSSQIHTIPVSPQTIFHPKSILYSSQPTNDTSSQIHTIPVSPQTIRHPKSTLVQSAHKRYFIPNAYYSTQPTNDTLSQIHTIFQSAHKRYFIPNPHYSSQPTNDTSSQIHTIPVNPQTILHPKPLLFHSAYKPKSWIVCVSAAISTLILFSCLCGCL